MPDAAGDRSRSAAPLAAARAWAALLLALLAAMLAVRASDRLPRPVPASAPADVFSADRAWPTLTHLADSIGDRVAGTAGGRRAAAHVAERLRAIPGVEVVVQDAQGARRGRGRLRRYRATNVLARIPGRRRDAVLLSTHWDTPIGSVGASDAGVPTAVVVEVARALAAGPPLERTVILNINGAEEQGLLGADGFLHHPWARDVEVFVDLESAGPGGKATLFQVGPGAAWLARTYARSAPHPHGTVIGQDIFQSGAIPSGTDFEIYRDAGLAGLDLAFFENGWAYHTSRDRTWNVHRGSVQQMGANALALARALAAVPEASAGSSPAVYYDVFGMTMLTYDQRSAAGIAIVVLLLAAASIVLAARRGRARAPLAAAAGATAALPLAVLVTVAVAAVAPLLLGRPHGWYARPWLAVAAFAPIALGVMLAVHWLVARPMRRLPPTEREPAAIAGSLAALALCYAALTLAGVGSAYLLLWWVAPASIALLFLASRPHAGARPRGAAIGAALLPGALLTLQLLVLLLRLFAPIAGRFPLAIPFDLPIAAIVATTTALLATLPLATIHRVGRFGAAAGTSLAIGTAGLAALALVDPYDAAHPQRIDVVHRSDPDGDRIELAGWDWPGIGRAVASVEGAVADDPGRRSSAARVPASAAPFPPPRLEVLSATGPSRSGDRSVSLRIPPEDGVHLHRLSIPADRLAGWSLGALPVAANGRIVLELLDAPPEGWTVTLDLRGAGSVPIELGAVRAATTPDAARVIDELPDWTTTTARAVVVGRIDL